MGNTRIFTVKDTDRKSLEDEEKNRKYGVEVLTKCAPMCVPGNFAAVANYSFTSQRCSATVHLIRYYRSDHTFVPVSGRRALKSEERVFVQKTKREEPSFRTRLK